jgi:hypothetical protein
MLFEALSAHGGTVAELLDQSRLESSGEPGPPQVAAAGPRAAHRPEEYELLLEMIYEGSHLHYGPQRLVRTDDPDLALLVGDQLYALGLARLATLGDLDAISELADVISLVAQAFAASDPDLADAVWEAGAVAIGWGSDDRHAAAKQLARGGSPRATTALREAARAAESVRAVTRAHGQSS